MAVQRQGVAKAVTGGVIGLVVGFIIALLFSGFRIVEAMIAVAWCLPFILGLMFFYMRDRSGAA